MGSRRRADRVGRLWHALSVPDNARRSITWGVGMALGTWETLSQRSPRAIVYAFVGSLIGIPEVVARARRIIESEEAGDDDPSADED